MTVSLRSPTETSSFSGAGNGSWPEGNGAERLQIAVGTFGILALELGLIRWFSGQIRIFAYLTNVVLISAFLGMGLGLLIGPRRPGLRHLTLPLLAGPFPLVVQLPPPGSVPTVPAAMTGTAGQPRAARGTVVPGSMGATLPSTASSVKTQTTKRSSRTRARLGRKDL